ncbi:glycosyltransferase family 2 protein [Polaribacter atrinae]|uniref:glycosyltransferase family 2 protein n=1 Tax=Polaribacter atrinae TaxID=1333662 RepID=UPI0030FA1521
MSINYPKISIVTPNYNGAEYLEETILSVLNQNYPNLEYIIIDGGSSDNSIDIIKKYEDQLSYWVSEPDKGLYDAIQKGFELSTGEIMAWINSDDMYVKGAFSIVSEIFFNFKQVYWLLGIPSLYDEKGRIVNIQKFKRWSKFDYYINDYEWIQQESVFWRRSLWESSGSKMNTNLKLAGDLELWTRFFRKEKLYSIDALLSGFRVRSSNQLSLDSIEDYHKEAKEVLKLELNTKASEEDRLKVNQILKNKEIDIISNRISRFYKSKFNNKKISFEYAPLFYFDRISQSFKLKK